MSPRILPANVRPSLGRGRHAGTGSGVAMAGAAARGWAAFPVPRIPRPGPAAGRESEWRQGASCTRQHPAPVAGSSPAALPGPRIGRPHHAAWRRSEWREGVSRQAVISAPVRGSTSPDIPAPRVVLLGSWACGRCEWRQGAACSCTEEVAMAEGRFPAPSRFPGTHRAAAGGSGVPSGDREPRAQSRKGRQTGRSAFPAFPAPRTAAQGVASGRRNEWRQGIHTGGSPAGLACSSRNPTLRHRPDTTSERTPT